MWAAGYLGFLMSAWMALAQGRANRAGVWYWLILGAVFFADATVTLVRRGLRHERLHEAHRSHAYQWLARRWQSHGRVTASVLAINLLVLLPLAILATQRPTWAASLTVGALLPLCLVAIATGSGERESSVQVAAKAGCRGRAAAELAAIMRDCCNEAREKMSGMLSLRKCRIGIIGLGYVGCRSRSNSASNSIQWARYQGRPGHKP